MTATVYHFFFSASQRFRTLKKASFCTAAEARFDEIPVERLVNVRREVTMQWQVLRNKNEET